MTVRDIEASGPGTSGCVRAQTRADDIPHYEREDTGYGVLLVEPRRAWLIGLHTNTGNNGAPFDEAQTGMRPRGFNVSGREELEAWTSVASTKLVRIERTRGIRTGDEPFPYATQ